MFTGSGFSVTDSEFKFLEEFVREKHIKTVLEFGPGKSTSAFIKAGAKVVTYESHWFWHARYRGILMKYGDAVDVRLYKNEPEIILPELEGLTFGLAFIDGPHAGSQKDIFPFWTRRNTIAVAAKHTSRIILHDARRRHERDIIGDMKAKGWEIEFVPTEKGLAVMRRLKI